MTPQPVTAGNDLSGAVALETGGGRGVGRGITTRLLDAGAEVVICGRNEPDDAPTAGGRTASFVAADVRDEAAVDALVAAVTDRHGRLDIVVYNAGGSPPSDAADVSPRFVRSIIDLNLTAQFLVAQAANRVMQDQPEGGSIVNITSVSGLRPSPGTAAYGAAKAGLSPAEAFARGILCNALVCMAVWLAMGARSVADKVLAIVFPITAFVVAGFEHCIANWFFLPYAMGLGDPSSVPLAGVLANLFWVTLGNVVGGTLLVAGIYAWAYRPRAAERT